MNNVSLTQLKAVVEQAVRPVRATMACKGRMREELLAHLASVFEDEFARTGNENTAFDEAARRFGDPRALASQLQQSVPLWNRCRSIFQSMGGRPDESAWHLAVKHVLVLLAITAVVLPAFLWMQMGRGNSGRAIVEGFIQVEGLRRFIAAFVVGLLVLMTLLNAVLSICSAWLLNKIGPSLAAKWWGRCLLATPCVLMLPVILTPYAGAAVVFILMVRQVFLEARCRRDWAC